jgi:poly(A) polymerase
MPAAPDVRRPDAPALAALTSDRRVGALLSALCEEGEEARIVGGAVRDALLGRRVADVDVATTRLPASVEARARRAGWRTAPTGIEHGTVTVIVEGRPIEVTTLRADVETDGRRARVAFTRDFAVDAARRDFTINALSLDAEGRAYDYSGHGFADLEARRVRFFGAPADRIREDALRILRFFRFTASHGEGRLDGPGLEAAAGLRDGLRRLSAERVAAELRKLLLAPAAAPVLAAMAREGIDAALDLDFAPERFAAVERAETRLGVEPDPMRRLAALTGEAADPTALRERLRLSNEETARLAAAIAAAADPRRPAAATTPAALYRDGPVFARELVLARFAGGAIDDGEANAALAAIGAFVRPSSPFRAARLMALGVARGPALGAALAACERAWIEAGFPADAAALDAIERAAASSGAEPAGTQ